MNPEKKMVWFALAFSFLIAVATFFVVLWMIGALS